MKATKLVTLCTVPLIGLGIFAGISNQKAHAATNQPAAKTLVYDKHGDHVSTLTADLNNDTLSADKTDLNQSSVPTESNQTIVLTDRYGNTVQTSQLPAIQARGTSQPTKVKYLNSGCSKTCSI